MWVYRVTSCAVVGIFPEKKSAVTTRKSDTTFYIKFDDQRSYQIFGFITTNIGTKTIA